MLSYSQNEKGNIFVIAILIALILGIIAYSYFDSYKEIPSIFENTTKNKAIDRNIIFELETTNSFSIDGNILFENEVNGTCNDKNFYLKNVSFNNFYGFIDQNKKLISGQSEKIDFNKYFINTDCFLNVNYKNAKIFTNQNFNLDGNFKIKSKDLNQDFKNTTIYIENFKGVVILDVNTAILKGKCSEINIKNESINIKVK